MQDLQLHFEHLTIRLGVTSRIRNVLMTYVVRGDNDRNKYVDCIV